MKLTQAEKKWVKKVNEVLAGCPSKRLGFATIGDHDLTIFDNRRMGDIYAVLDRGNRDFIPAASSIGAVFDECIYFPQPVEGTAG